MAEGRSIHIGLDAVDPGHYRGQKYPLVGARNDALAMADIGAFRRYNVLKPLIGCDATRQNVLDAIKDAAVKLRQPDDTFLMTFAGHGTAVDRQDGQDKGKDEAWALYDGLLFDDELYACWTTFQPDVRICVVSDSCYGGGILSYLVYKAGSVAFDVTVFRYIPHLQSAAIYAAHKERYDAILQNVASDQKKPVTASVLLLAACSEQQLARDDSPHGLFTEKILDVWCAGNYPGSYENLSDEVQKRVEKENRYQVPAWSVEGVSNPRFYATAAFAF